jgi:hypothetical protein
VSDLFKHALQNCNDSDIVGITISNEENVQDKEIGISFRRSQLTPDVIWLVFGKVAQSNLDKLVLNIHYVKMPIGNGRGVRIAAKGRPLANMAHLKRVLLMLKLKKTVWPTH